MESREPRVPVLVATMVMPVSGLQTTLLIEFETTRMVFGRVVVRMFGVNIAGNPFEFEITWGRWRRVVRVVRRWGRRRPMAWPTRVWGRGWRRMSRR